VPAYLTEADVARVLTPGAAAEAVEGSFARLARGEVDNPPRVRLPIPDGQFAVMPCVDRGLGLAGLKTFAWTPGGTPFLVVLMTIHDPEIVAVLEADTLGQVRTAAASAVAAKHLARNGAASLGVIGCGRQAASHVAALRAQLPSLERVVIHCRDGGKRDAFCREHNCEPAGSASVAGECDVVVTATTAVTPVLQGEWLRDGALVLAVGANDPDARELDDAVLERVAAIYVDSREQAREEAGDLIEPATRGLVRWEDVHELQDVVAGTVEGRTDQNDVLVFKSSGLAAWDLAVAARVVELAR
jgi:ornithine cyclodeaminase/alanine dehydrogenase-like protein (mu-crystallin family)